MLLLLVVFTHVFGIFEVGARSSATGSASASASSSSLDTVPYSDLVVFFLALVVVVIVTVAACAFFILLLLKFTPRAIKYFNGHIKCCSI